MDQAEVHLSGPYGRERTALWQLARVKGKTPVELDEKAYTDSDSPVLYLQGVGPVFGFWPIFSCLEHRFPSPRLTPTDVATRASDQSLLHLLLTQGADLDVLADLSKYWRGSSPAYYMMGEHPTMVDLVILQLAGDHHAQLFPNLRRRVTDLLGDRHEAR